MGLPRSSVAFGTYERALNTLCLLATAALLIAKVLLPEFDTGTALLVASLILLVRAAPRLWLVWTGRQRLRHVVGGKRRLNLELLFPRGFLELLRMEKAAHTTFFAWLRRRPPKIDACQDLTGTTFLFDRAPSYGTAIAILLVAVATDVPLTILAVNLLVDSEVGRTMAHFALAFVTFYGFLWVIADRHALPSSAHVLSNHALHLRLGFRGRADIPLACIERVETLRANVSPRRFRSDNGLTRNAVVAVTPFDDPNVAVWVRESCDTEVVTFGTVTACPRVVLVYVDRPVEMAARLAETLRSAATGAE